MKKTRVVDKLPESVNAVIRDFNDKVRALDEANGAETPTTIDWTDLARAATTYAKSETAGAHVSPTALLQEMMAAKRAIREDPAKPDYITEGFLDDFAAAVVDAAQSKTAGINAKKASGNSEMVKG